MYPSVHLGVEVPDIITVSLTWWGSYVARGENVVVPDEDSGTTAAVTCRTSCECRDNIVEEILIPRRP